MKEQQPHIQKCEMFSRQPNGIYETQLCKATNAEVSCGGFSDGCEFPEEFVARDGIPRELVLFDISQVVDLTN